MDEKHFQKIVINWKTMIFSNFAKMMVKKQLQKIILKYDTF